MTLSIEEQKLLIVLNDIEAGVVTIRSVGKIVIAGCTELIEAVGLFMGLARDYLIGFITLQ